MTTIYTAPPFEPVSADYAVRVDGRSAHVSPVRVSAMQVNQIYRGRQRSTAETELASFVCFEGEGEAELDVSLSFEVFTACVTPASAKVKVDFDAHRARFTLPKPGSYTLEVNGVHKPLHIFYNPSERGAPNPHDKDVVYFAPGLHNAGEIRLKSRQTLYIAAGARVMGNVVIDDAEDVRVCGRGILDASDIPRAAARNCVLVTNSKRVTIEDVVLHDAPCFSVTVGGCEDVRVENVKVIGQWRYNSDGIDLHNSRNVALRRCFLRTFDDNIVLKGVHQVGGRDMRHASMSGIRVEDCVLWNDWGRALEIGAETVAESMHDIVFRRCEVLHFSFIACDVQACGDAHVYDVRFEDINVGEPLDPQVDPRLTEIFLRPMCWIKGDRMGRVSDVTFRNIAYTGRTCVPNRFIGYEADSDIRGVKLENVTINGERLTPSGCAMSKIIHNAFASDIRVDGAPADERSAIFEDDEATRTRFLVGNGAFIQLD